MMKVWSLPGRHSVWCVVTLHLALSLSLTFFSKNVFFLHAKKLEILRNPSVCHIDLTLEWAADKLDAMFPLKLEPAPPAMIDAAWEKIAAAASKKSNMDSDDEKTEGESVNGDDDEEEEEEEEGDDVDKDADTDGEGDEEEEGEGDGKEGGSSQEKSDEGDEDMADLTQRPMATQFVQAAAEDDEEGDGSQYVNTQSTSVSY